MFYYFIEGSYSVFEREEEVNLEEYPQFTPLTEEETEYYLEHPGSNMYQIREGIKPVHEPTIEEVRNGKKDEIRRYDSSDEVNGFFMGENVMWLTPDVRDNYINTLQGAQRLGIETVTFMGIDITPAQGIAILDIINVYAMQCVAVTEHHLAAVDQLMDIDAINNYDHTLGYPERLRFFSQDPTPEDEPEEPENNEPEQGNEGE